MPNWGTRSRGAGWFDAARVDSCSSECKGNLINAAAAILIWSPCLDLVPGLRECMTQKWNSITIYCSGKGCVGNVDGAYIPGFNGDCVRCIYICRCDGGTAWCRTKDILLHELVHACGGNELDSEIMEQLCSLCDPTNPTSGDYKEFCAETGMVWDGSVMKRFLIGRFFIVDPATGRVFVKAGYGDPSTRRPVLTSPYFITPC